MVKKAVMSKKEENLFDFVTENEGMSAECEALKESHFFYYFFFISQLNTFFFICIIIYCITFMLWPCQKKLGSLSETFLK